jgi:hypothetical protein
VDGIGDANLEEEHLVAKGSHGGVEGGDITDATAPARVAVGAAAPPKESADERPRGRVLEERGSES